MKIQSGIVLKIYSSSEVVVLDKERGKIVAKIQGRNVHMHATNGAMLSYMLQERGSSYSIHIVDLEYVPFTFACHDIFFLHHILELCYYFLPMGCVMEDVFDFLLFLFKEQGQKLQAGKRVIVTRLCYMFGLYPDDTNIPQCMDMIMHCPLDQLLEISVDVVVNTWLDQWIWSCIKTHPLWKRFKTIELLKRADSHDR